jgi:glycosyltransferase involved in cell wall biosynthesis
VDKITERVSTDLCGPRISVVMPAYNCAAYIREAVDSVVRQTEKDWELLILEDCSTDNTLEMLADIQDPRIRVIPADRNIGQANQLNKGIGMARGEFIAIAHADDINEPNRFAAQLDLFRKAPGVGVTGTWIRYAGNREGIEKYPVGTENCLMAMLDDSPVAHPTVMIRKEVLDRLPLLYRQDMVPAEDFELWARMMPLTKFDNVPECLLQYRVHGGQISEQKKQELGSKIAEIKKIFLDYNFDSLDAASRSALATLVELRPGMLMTRRTIVALSRLPRALSAHTGIAAGKWRGKIGGWLRTALIRTQNYQTGAGIVFLFFHPWLLFAAGASDTVRIIRRSVHF